MEILRDPIKILIQHRQLISQFSQREILTRYRGSFLGLLWAFINPLVMLAVYTFVFSFVFKGRWGQSQSTNPFEFALIMFCGIIAFNIFSETVNRAPSLIIGNVNYVKKVVFPLDIFPVTVMVSSIVHSLISIFLLIIGVFLFLGNISWTIILLPFVMLPLVFLSLGFSWFLSSLGVYVRDIGYSIGLITNMLFFITPVFYPIEAVPKFFRPYLLFNPLSTIVDEFRSVILWGAIPDIKSYFIVLIVSIIVFYFGYVWFAKTRKGFADVL